MSLSAPPFAVCYRQGQRKASKALFLHTSQRWQKETSYLLYGFLSSCHRPNTDILHAPKSWPLSTSFHPKFSMSKLELLACFFYFKEKNNQEHQGLLCPLYSNYELKRTETRCGKCHLKMEVISMSTREDIMKFYSLDCNGYYHRQLK